ncbi:hypothetical protein BP6252_05578 [Coleophoma cylindrospora]|uniref:Cytochrome P450 n=1 Tax=Coleophoma cylindrospora TaxID=1849047 RepID=A0A3D8RU44_9HELO|nr:hypothetical protein BP6252_05578 [Coleophoma cylindrospora]
MAVVAVLGALVVALALQLVYGAYWRLYRSPLSQFPGPKLAAVTGWYEFYWNIWRGGEFFWEIQRMHQKYGPIVRINPWEIHVNDPDWYDELYAGGAKRRDKYLWFTAGSGSPYSTFETTPHDVHRLRRAAINPFFSKKSIVAIEPIILTQISSLSSLFRGYLASGKTLDLRVAYSSLTLDIISAYCFGESWNCLKDEAKGEEWKTTLDVIFENSNLGMHFPWLLTLINMLPDSLANPVIRHHRNTRKHVTAVLKHEDDESQDQSSIFHVLRDGELPAHEKTVQRLSDEGNILIGAGAETTAQVLAVISYHLLANPEILRRLRAELDPAMPNGEAGVKWTQLEQLPYLTAVLNEGLRMASPALTRLPRIAPNEELVYGKWSIPAGTPVSMTYYFTHYNSKIYPSPFEFNPDRWIDATQSGVRLDKYLVPFSKGSRNCAGINLAWAELYLAAAVVFRKFDMELYETTRADVDIARDCFVPQPKKGSQGIRVKIVGERS